MSFFKFFIPKLGFCFSLNNDCRSLSIAATSTFRLLLMLGTKKEGMLKGIVGN